MHRHSYTTARRWAKREKFHPLCPNADEIDTFCDQSFHPPIQIIVSASFKWLLSAVSCLRCSRRHVNFDIQLTVRRAMSTYSNAQWSAPSRGYMSTKCDDTAWQRYGSPWRNAHCLVSDQLSRIRRPRGTLPAWWVISYHVQGVP